MKKFIVTAFLAVFATAGAQDVTKNLGDFSKVRVFDKISVKLVKSNQNRIEVSGSRADDVEIVTKGSDLKIRMKLTKLLQGEDITATVYYKFIDEVEASEGAYVVSDDTFKVTSMKLNSKEGAKIKMNLDVQKVEAKLRTGGEIELEGKASNQDVKINTGGIFKGRNLATSQTSVSINAGGEADVNATELVDAKTVAGGTINVFGSPKQVNKKTTAGGSIDIRG